MVEMYDGSKEDFDKVLFIEQLALPILRDRSKDESDSSKDDFKSDDVIRRK
jgi:hypothetical protein